MVSNIRVRAKHVSDLDEPFDVESDFPVARLENFIKEEDTMTIQRGYENARAIMKNPNANGLAKLSAKQVIKYVHDNFGRTITHETIHNVLDKLDDRSEAYIVKNFEDRFTLTNYIDNYKLFGYGTERDETGFAPFEAMEANLERYRALRGRVKK